MLEHPPHDLVRPLPGPPSARSWRGTRSPWARSRCAYRLAASHGLTSGQTFAELEFFAGWVALRFLREPDIAYDHFVQLYDEVKLPISVARGAYWAARAAEAMGYHQLAAAWYGTAAVQVTTYYGQLAATALGEPDIVHGISEPQADARRTAAFDKRELVRAMRELAAAGADDYIGPFARRVSEQATVPADYVLARRTSPSGSTGPTSPSPWPRSASYAGVTLLDEGYPITDLPPGGAAERPLVLAMTRQESAFDHEAVSSAGARGMMQLMPATASHDRQDAAHAVLGQPAPPIALQYHARAAYLDGLLGDFSGSYVLAIAAYNAGPARVHQWIRDYGDPARQEHRRVDWIERSHSARRAITCSACSKICRSIAFGSATRPRLLAGRDLKR